MAVAKGGHPLKKEAVEEAEEGEEANEDDAEAEADKEGAQRPKLDEDFYEIEAVHRKRVRKIQQILEQELQVAIKEENYAKAAKLRDTLRSIQEDSKASVLAANAEFYRSFKNGDLSAMQAIWSKGDHVCCVHPGVLGISGYESVMDSWIHVWGNYEFPLEIELREVRVHVRGDLGYVTCVELVKTKGSSWGGQFVTNVFERSDGQWFICVHHASPVDF
ncbi:uncharacterized protein LOC104448692 [Eucalyptus grandis]|uniref:uncharacterized protein LOC104448692 n=1 Tax=Eucalyptus grandis TaxID=71139 RepID=UPI00192EEFFE|nr:uncharacterized protein LOC104448692 [Eucalyptus grandis]